MVHSSLTMKSCAQTQTRNEIYSQICVYVCVCRMNYGRLVGTCAAYVHLIVATCYCCWRAKFIQTRIKYTEYVKAHECMRSCTPYKGLHV